MRGVFVPADILVPSGIDMENWSVVACDQFTSERDYWLDVEARTRGCFSTYHMILPEAFLREKSVMDAADECRRAMESYLADGIFQTLRDSFVYVERKVSGGVRRGIVGAIDLEAYDFRPGSTSKIRASERTVMERLPARMLLRENAPLELPHAMVLIDDPDGTVIEPLRGRVGSMRKLYDFELMSGGGHIRGYQVDEKSKEDVLAALGAIGERDLAIVTGDGNHSLAAAKELWERTKQGLTESEAAVHPARYALAELNNVYDPAVEFQPIHRVAFNTDPAKLLEMVREKLGGDGGHRIEVMTKGRVSDTVTVRGRNFGQMLDRLQGVIEEYVAMTDGSVDYIHDREAVTRLTMEPGSVGFLMPAMDKSELFRTVASEGVFPKKSFSIGHARDKRYYLECRRIK